MRTRPDYEIREAIDTLVSRLATPQQCHDSQTSANDDTTPQGQTLYASMGAYTVDNLHRNAEAYTTPKVQVQDRKTMYWR